MADALYERPYAAGLTVRIRRVTAEGEQPVAVVLEVDRRAGAPRPGAVPGHPPALAEASGATEREALTSLLPLALEDGEIARLMRDRGVR